MTRISHKSTEEYGKVLYEKCVEVDTVKKKFIPYIALAIAIMLQYYVAYTQQVNVRAESENVTVKELADRSKE